MLSLEGDKGIALALLFIITCITSFSPMYLRKLYLKKFQGKRAEIGLSGCLCAAAGILLGTIFLHILPEAVEAVERAVEERLISPISYPVIQVTLCFGFFLIYFIDELVHHYINRKTRGHHHQNSSSVNVPNRENHANEGYEGPNKVRNDTAYSIEMGDVEDSCSAHTNVHTHTHDYLKSTSIVGSLFVIVALSFHSFLEGMSLGLETRNQGVWLVFAALVSHKIFIAFSMSLELLEVGVPPKMFSLFMLIFSSASPIGGVVGTIIVAKSSGTETAVDILAPAFLQAISAGTIMYVTFCEVLERERAKCDGGLVKFASLVLGFSIMALLQLLEHGHENSGDDHENSVQGLKAFGDPRISTTSIP